MRDKIKINIKYETETQRQMMLRQIFRELIEGYRAGWNTDATTGGCPFKFKYNVKKISDGVDSMKTL